MYAQANPDSSFICRSREHKSESSAGIDDRVLMELFNSLVKDPDLVQFFENIPGLCKSSIVDNPLLRVTWFGKKKLYMAAKELLDRTWCSHFLSDSVKLRRVVACVNFADAARLQVVALSILYDISLQESHNSLRSVELGQLLRQGNRGLEKIGLCAQSVMAIWVNTPCSMSLFSGVFRWLSLGEETTHAKSRAIRPYSWRSVRCVGCVRDVALVYST